MDIWDQSHPQLPDKSQCHPELLFPALPQARVAVLLIQPGPCIPWAQSSGRFSHLQQVLDVLWQTKKAVANLCSLPSGMSPLQTPSGQASMGRSTHTILLSPGDNFFFIFQSRQNLLSIPQANYYYAFFPSDISFCLIILILPVYGSVLLQGFKENRKNNTFFTYRY